MTRAVFVSKLNEQFRTKILLLDVRDLNTYKKPTEAHLGPIKNIFWIWYNEFPISL